MENFITRPIGEIFTHNSITLEVVKVDGIYCGECYFHQTNGNPRCIYKTDPLLGYCNSLERSDQQNIIFKPLTPLF